MENANTGLIEQGARYKASGVDYCIWSPQASLICVEILKSARVVRHIKLAKDEDGFHRGRDWEGKPGDCYKFRLEDGESYPDPSSRWQPQGVHGPSMVVDATGFAWGDALYARPLFRDLVIS